MRTTEEITRDLQKSLLSVYAGRLQAFVRPDGKWAIAVPQPTLEGGDVSVFVLPRDGKVLLHDNGRTAIFLATMAIDPRTGKTRDQMQEIAQERGCEYWSGRLQVSVRAGEDPASAALGLVDAIKTVSDLALHAREKVTREHMVAAKVKEYLLERYHPTQIRTRAKVRGEAADHVVDFAVTKGERWCIVKPVEGREIMYAAAAWLGAWRDIWLRRLAHQEEDGLVGAVSVYRTTGLVPGEVEVAKDILARLGPEVIAIPVNGAHSMYDAVETRFTTLPR